MKSATSFFNPTLLKKNLTRYWPIWALYTLIWTYALPVRCLMVVSRNQLWMGDTPVQQVKTFANEIPNLLEGFGTFMAFSFGILTAMGMFSYLYNNRSAGMMHTLPIRREGLFLTGYVSGLVCLLGSHCVVWLLTLAAEGLSGYMDLYTISIWLAAQSAMCLFFYSFAVFCAMFTGHLLALPAFYGILNFLAIVVFSLVDYLVEPFLYGFAGLPGGASTVVEWLTPAMCLGEEVRWRRINSIYRLEGVAELAIYAAVGLILAGLALLVYRRRHVETAGDVVSVSVVKPIFKYGVALCSGLCLGFWLHAMFGINIPGGLTGNLLLWTAIGYFVAEMLLKKSFRVWKAWRGGAVLLALVAVGLFWLQMDGFGFVSRVPSLQSVVSVKVEGRGGYPYDEGRTADFTTEDRDIIAKTVALHKAIVNEHQNPEFGNGSDSEYFGLDVTYTLTNGTVLRRSYHISMWRDTRLARAAEDFFCDPEVAKLAYDLEQIDPQRLTGAEVSSLRNTVSNKAEHITLAELRLSGTPYVNKQDALQALYHAVLLDFEQGNLGKRYLFDLDEERQLNTYTSDLYLYWDVPQTGKNSFGYAAEAGAGSVAVSYTDSMRITLTPQAEHTIRVLTELGILDEDTTMRLYREIVDEELRAKFPEGDPNSLPDDAFVRAVTGSIDLY